MDFDRWFANQKAHQDEPEPNWHPDEWLGDQHPDKQARLLEMRGGCRCCISPPCSACVDPVTDDEAEKLGLVSFATHPTKDTP